MARLTNQEDAMTDQEIDRIVTGFANTAMRSAIVYCERNGNDLRNGDPVPDVFCQLQQRSVDDEREPRRSAEDDVE